LEVRKKGRKRRGREEEKEESLLVNPSQGRVEVSFVPGLLGLGLGP
jgi:hypothetical protein